jgi:predicted nucleic acid-binding protein
LNETLGKGESACIVLYKEISADLLILDDLKARKTAQNLDIKLTGLLGILKMARKKQLISSLSDIFNGLEKANFRISRNLVDIILIEVN